MQSSQTATMLKRIPAMLIKVNTDTVTSCSGMDKLDTEAAA